jgi:hypothetical protein
MFLIEAESLGEKNSIFGTLPFYVNELRMSVANKTESRIIRKCIAHKKAEHRARLCVGIQAHALQFLEESQLSRHQIQKQHLI